jgi:DNA-binding transcriptional regulator YhcF (GntR family)
MTRSRTTSVLELLVELDRTARDPLHRQLEVALRAAVREGRLAPGSPLPSSRALAGQLGISRGIVVEAYEQLVAEGYLTSRPGGATMVARGGASAPASRDLPPLETFEFDFRPGRPDVTEFPRAVWLRSLRRVLANAPSERLTYLQGRAVPELAAALATYLNRVRGTSASAADIVAATGFAQGLALTARALRASGARRIAVEDPSDPEYRATIRAADLEWAAIPVDGDGIRVDRLNESDADAVIVTAAHQYPTGAVLSAERRQALLDWATRRRATIVEDDYDAEFRYDREPIGALQGLARERELVERPGSHVRGLLPLGHRVGERRQDDEPAQPQPGREDLARGSAIDEALRGETLERADRLAVVAELCVVVVLDDRRSASGRPADARLATLSAQDGPGRILVRGRDDDRVHVALDQPIDADSVLVDRDRRPRQARRSNRRPILRIGWILDRDATRPDARSARAVSARPWANPVATTMSAAPADVPRTRLRYVASAVASSGTARPWR